MKSIWKKPSISHKDFVRMYKAKEISVFIHRANALNSISQGYLPKRYFWAHTIWSWFWFISIPAGIIMLFFNIYVGLGILLVSFFHQSNFITIFFYTIQQFSNCNPYKIWDRFTIKSIVIFVKEFFNLKL